MLLSGFPVYGWFGVPHREACFCVFQPAGRMRKSALQPTITDAILVEN
jgi:hypothetical protein